MQVHGFRPILAVTMMLGMWPQVAAAKAPVTNQVTAASKLPQITFETSAGTIVVRLFADKAPLSTSNLLTYVKAGFYDGTIFHRVIADFMIQGGGFTSDLKQKATRAPIKNEADNGLLNKRGTVAMARTAALDSATAQFFINTQDNSMLDHTPSSFGYAVVGEVIAGMDVVDKIRRTEVLCPSHIGKPCQENLPPGMGDVPKTPIVIRKATAKTFGAVK